MIIHIAESKLPHPQKAPGTSPQICVCTGEPPAGQDQTTRVVNRATCQACIDLWSEQRGMSHPFDPSSSYSGVVASFGIVLQPALWNCERLPGREETLLAYFFKLIYMERLRQIKRWGDQRHPDGTGPGFSELASYLKATCQRNAARGRVTWLDILLEEVGETAECDPITDGEQLRRRSEPTPEDDRDLEAEMVQSAAVLAAWHSDLARRAEELSVVKEKRMFDEALPVDVRRQLVEESPKIDTVGFEEATRRDGGASAYGLGLPGAEPDGRGVEKAHTFVDRYGAGRIGESPLTTQGLTGQQGVNRLRDAIRKLGGEPETGEDVPDETAQ